MWKRRMRSATPNTATIAPENHGAFRGEASGVTRASICFGYNTLRGIRDGLVVAVALLAAVPARAADPTYTKDIAPILFEHCAMCHRPGQVGPFSLLTYRDARQHLTQIV